MKTIVIAAFPGVGKSYVVKNNAFSIKVVDLDSNTYTQGHDAKGNVVNKHFPHNYFRAIKEQIGSTDVVLISIHKEILDILKNEAVDFTLVYPDINLKAEYITRFEERKNSKEFVELFSENWQLIIRQLQYQEGCKHVILKSGQFLSDIILEQMQR